MQVMAAKKQALSVLSEKKERLNGKYLRRAEVESLLEAKDETSPASCKKLKRSDDSEGQSPSRPSLEKADRASATDSLHHEAERPSTLAWPDLRRRLRELGEPITLFGETIGDRMTRLRRVEIDAVTKHEEGLGAGHNIRNRFVGGDADGRGDQRDSVDDAAEDAEEFEAQRGRHERKKEDTKDEDEKDADKLVYRFFRDMLHHWERELATRPDHVKHTMHGKVAVKTMKQCKDYIRPLFKLCKQRQVPADILPKLVDIVTFCRQGEFVQANDAYIKLAIGNAAWPIGVTMVGIHERTGREKIHSNKQAHVMNNEAQRKYLTSVKRLISYAQSISSALPSKRVM